jgi:hypothetical protein
MGWQRMPRQQLPESSVTHNFSLLLLLTLFTMSTLAAHQHNGLPAVHHTSFTWHRAFPLQAGQTYLLLVQQAMVQDWNPAPLALNDIPAN